MSRYDSAGVEAEYEPGSRGRVLRNQFGIKTKREIDRAEFDLLLLAQETLAHSVSRDTPFTAALICQMHAEWLSSLYAWAGKYRTVNMSKGGFAWPPASLVFQNMANFEATILRNATPCHITDLEPLSLKLAEIQSELLLIHPFREGNGRTARWVTNLIAGQAGFSALDYGFLGRGKKAREIEYLNGVRAGYAGHYERLARLLREALLRGLDGDSD